MTGTRYDGQARVKRKAPWPDYAGNPIYDGDTIVHPDGTLGVVVFLPDVETESDSSDIRYQYKNWRVRYADDAPNAAPVWLLCMQIGDKGCAVVVPKLKARTLSPEELGESAAALRGVTPKVKPLVFENGVAESLIGWFKLYEEAGEHWFSFDQSQEDDYRPYPDYIFKTAAEAEADAQAFYAKKILSCVEIPEHPVAETCATCKHRTPWIRDTEGGTTSVATCNFMRDWNFDAPYIKSDFGCNKWERKE